MQAVKMSTESLKRIAGSGRYAAISRGVSGPDVLQATDDIQQAILGRLAAIEQSLSYTYNPLPPPNWSQQQPYMYQAPQPYKYQSPQPYQPPLSDSPQVQQLCQTPQSSPSMSVLSPSVINKENLKSASLVIKQHPKLRGDSKAGTLAVKLAHQAIFSDDVLAQCTPGGSRDLPALPNDELNTLKEEMFDQFSQYWSNPVEFEVVWGVCVNAVGQACKRL